MLRRNWLLLAALVVLAGITVAIGVVTWPLQSALKSYGEADPRNDRYAAGGEQCQPKVLSAIGDRIERAGRATACAKEAEEYRQKTNDLIQQTRAADAAQSQTEIASQQLWTGWLQTLGGFLTLAAAVGAAIYARAAAKETKRSNDYLTGVNEPTVHVEMPTVTMKEGAISGRFDVFYYGQVKSVFSNSSWNFWTASEGNVIDENRVPIRLGELSSSLKHQVPIGMNLNPAERVALSAGTLDMVFEFETSFLPRFETVPRSYRKLYRFVVIDDKIEIGGLSEENFLQIIGRP